MKKIIIISAILSYLLSTYGCSSVPAAFTHARGDTGKNYTRFLWGNQKRYIVFQLKNSDVSPILASAAPYNGAKENLYCITTEQELCENFPASNKEIFSRVSHKKFMNNILGALSNGGTIKIDINTVTGDKVFDPEMVKTALNVLSQKIFSGYTAAKENEEKLLEFIEKYQINTDNEDILVALSNAYNKTSDIKQKAAIERYLVNQSIVKFQNPELSSSKLKKIKSSSLLYSAGASGRDYHQKLTVLIDRDAGIPIQYNRYKVKIRATFYLDFHPPINGENKDFLIKEKSVLLTPANGYKAPVDIFLEGVPSFGFVRPMGLGLLTGMSRMLGFASDKEAREVDRGIPFELKKIRPEYEVISIETI